MGDMFCFMDSCLRNASNEKRTVWGLTWKMIPIYSLQVKGFKDDIAEPSSEVKF